MGMTIVEKILANHAIPQRKVVKPGDIVKVRVDAAYMLNVGFDYLKVWDPNRIMITTADHNIPCRTSEQTNAADRSRKWAKQWGIKYLVDLGRGGNCHRVAAMLGMQRPGEICLCNDSHTTLGGAFNCLSMGMGPAELANIITKGETWFSVSPTIQIQVVDKLPKGVFARDILLYLGGAYPPFVGRNIEYRGPVVDALSIEDRMCMTCASTEISCDFPICQADQKTIDWVASRSTLPGSFQPIQADENAHYEDTIVLNSAELQPQIACPHTMANVKSAAEVMKEEVKIDQAVVCSCVNSGLVDIEVVAKVLKGRKIHPDVRLLVTPGTQEIWREAVRMGYAEIISEANGLFTVASCGPCSGGCQSLAPGEISIGSNTRNFRGRMGHSESTLSYCASPATVAASAITGYITDPR
jgi:3-isopropylmalate/(R)-2-methylmalate dehydratase large subunit